MFTWYRTNFRPVENSCSKCSVHTEPRKPNENLDAKQFKNLNAKIGDKLLVGRVNDLTKPAQCKYLARQNSCPLKAWLAGYTW